MRRAGLLCLLAVALPACTTDPAVLPAAPDGVAATPLTTTRVQVAWNDLSDNEAAFVVQTSPDNVVWTHAVTAAQNVTTAIVTGLVPGVQVFIRVAAENVKGMVPSALSAAATPPLPAWTSLGAGPGALFWTCSAFDPTRRLMIVFGGMDGLLATYNDLWALELDAVPPTWSPIAPAIGNVPPSPRFGSSLIYDPLGDRLVLFGGGFSGPAVTSEIWEFRMSTSQWFPLAASGVAPSARQHHGAIYDAGLSRMVVYGGDGLAGYPSEVHALTLPATGLPAWSTFPLAGPAPTPRVYHSMVYDASSRRMIVYAGLDNDNVDGSVLAGDVWSLDLSAALPAAWTPIATLGGPPAFRLAHMAVWDSVNLQMVVFGGADDDLFFPHDEVWTLTMGDAPTWRRWSPLVPTPGPRQLGAAVFDPVAVRMIVFGGAVDDFLTPTDDTSALGL